MKTRLLLGVLMLVSVPIFGQAESDSVEYTDTLRVHFLYGSKPKKAHKKTQERWFGGMLGGHVGIQYDSTRFLSFFYEGPVHVFQKPKKKNGKYELQSDTAFYHIMDEEKVVDSVKTLIVSIPITAQQRKDFEDVCARYIAETPYDYAFFGVRCGSSTYDVLAQIGVLPELRYSKMWRKIFYPKKLRKRLITKAEKKQWKMRKKKGTKKRIWEKD